VVFRLFNPCGTMYSIGCSSMKVVGIKAFHNDKRVPVVSSLRAFLSEVVYVGAKRCTIEYVNLELFFHFIIVELVPFCLGHPCY
jgi:hypothetical protein